MKQCKTIDIIGKSWRDKRYGNTYQSARIIIDMDATGEGTMIYVDFAAWDYMDAARNALVAYGYVPKSCCLTAWCREHGIVLRYGVTDALQREVRAWGVRS